MKNLRCSRAFYCCKMCEKSKSPPFLYYEIILFSGLMDREKDQKIGADFNTTPQPGNGPLICVFSHSPHSVKFVSRFHWVHATVAPSLGNSCKAFRSCNKQTNKCNKKRCRISKKFFITNTLFFFGWVNKPKNFFTTLLAITRLLDFWVHYPTLPYPKLKNHYPSGPCLLYTSDAAAE